MTLVFWTGIEQIKTKNILPNKCRSLNWAAIVKRVGRYITKQNLLFSSWPALPLIVKLKIKPGSKFSDNESPYWDFVGVNFSSIWLWKKSKNITCYFLQFSIVPQSPAGQHFTQLWRFSGSQSLVEVQTQVRIYNRLQRKILK